MAGARGASRGTIRWRPTSEQVMILEELFKGGIKSPTSHQVQKITTRLKEHGKVESKNVFYWFQNHKAREKQKLRRKLIGQHQQMLQLQVLNKEFVYYNIQHPHPHFACGFLPFFPTQVVETQDNESSWGITWLPTDSDSDHHRRNRPLETLQLFPTTAATTRETTTTATASSGAAATSASSNMSSSSRILISL